MQFRTELAYVVGFHQLDTAAGQIRATGVEAGARDVDRPLGGRGGGAEAVAAVDPVLGGDQRRQDVSALLRSGEVLAHHAGQEPAPAVGGGHGDGGDRVGGHELTTDRSHLLREGPEGRHATVPVEGPEQPPRLELVSASLQFRLRHGRLPQKPGMHGTQPFGILGLGDRTDVYVGWGAHGATVGGRG